MKIGIEKNVMVAMRDGTRLATNLLLPESGAPTPVILIRTPYSKDSDMGHSVGFAPSIWQFAEAGYAVAVQDTRGAFGSDGKFGNFADETPDGEDMIAWLAKQPWCDGNVGMIGASYLAKTQLAAVKASPPALKAIVPIVAVHDGQRLGWARDGVPFAYDYAFALMMALNDAKRAMQRGEPSNLPAVMEALQGMDLGHLPFADRPELKDFQFWRNIVDHPNRDAQWRSEALEDASAVRVPALHLCGWYDTGNPSFWDLFEMIHRDGGTEEARKGQRIVVGPWTHGEPTGVFAGRSFGPLGNAQAIDLHGLVMRFFDCWLKGKKDALDKDPAIRLFLMGADEWRDYQSWPIGGTTPTDLFLSSGAAANTADGDGVLVTQAPKPRAEDVFLSNPRRPVPTRLSGSNGSLPGVELPGPYDQSAVEKREDVLCYTTAPLTEPVEVIGRMSLRLFVSSSARDTDFVAKLIDVQPDGRAIILTDGICRTRFRSSLSDPELMTAGKVYELTIDLAATANRFDVGHRIRLEISGSSFPRYVRNSNTGGDIVNEGLGDFVVALNHVLHGADHPSRLTLPVAKGRI